MGAWATKWAFSYLHCRGRTWVMLFLKEQRAVSQLCQTQVSSIFVIVINIGSRLVWRLVEWCQKLLLIWNLFVVKSRMIYVKPFINHVSCTLQVISAVRRDQSFQIQICINMTVYFFAPSSSTVVHLCAGIFSSNSTNEACIWWVQADL